MLDSNEILQSKIDFYSQEQYVNDPAHVAGFKGTWAISDHTKIPDTVIEFLQYRFGVAKVRRIPLDQINSALNDVWEGPGSLTKLFKITDELKKSGVEFKYYASDYAPAKKDRSLEEDNEEYLADIPLSSFGDDPEFDLEE